MFKYLVIALAFALLLSFGVVFSLGYKIGKSSATRGSENPTVIPSTNLVKPLPSSNSGDPFLDYWSQYYGDVE